MDGFCWNPLFTPFFVWNKLKFVFWVSQTTNLHKLLYQQKKSVFKKNSARSPISCTENRGGYPPKGGGTPPFLGGSRGGQKGGVPPLLGGVPPKKGSKMTIFGPYWPLLGVKPPQTTKNDTFWCHFMVVGGTPPSFQCLPRIHILRTKHRQKCNF